MFWISGTKSYEAPTRDPDRPKLEFLWFAICSSPLAFPWRWGRWKCCFRLLSWSSFVTFSSDQGSTIWLAMGCTPVMLAQSRVSHFCAPSLRLPEQVLFLLTFAMLWRTSLENDLSSIFVGDHSFASKHTQDWLWIGNGEEAFGPLLLHWYQIQMASTMGIPRWQTYSDCFGACLTCGFCGGILPTASHINLCTNLYIRCLIHSSFSLFYSSANMLPSSYQALVKIVLKQGSPHRLFSFVADTIRYSHRSLVAFMQPVRATMMHSGTFFLLIATDCPAWRSYHCTWSAWFDKKAGKVDLSVHM